MRYPGLPAAMWILFSGSFRKHLTEELNYGPETAARITKEAKKQYRGIIRSLPRFEYGDSFRMITVNCALYCAFLLALPGRPDADTAAVYYRKAMMTGPMKWYCRVTEKQRFTKKDLARRKKAADLRAADRNPYSYNIELRLYEDGSGYEMRYTSCGICTLMRELGLYDYVPGMCLLEYDMSLAGGVTQFVREYTFPTGGAYCDCGYRKKKE